MQIIIIMIMIIIIIIIIITLFLKVLILKNSSKSLVETTGLYKIIKIILSF